MEPTYALKLGQLPQHSGVMRCSFVPRVHPRKS